MVPDDGVRVLDGTERRFAEWYRASCPRAGWAVPDSETFPDGIKYRLHCGIKNGKTLIRYDNSHGVHERHPPTGIDEDYEFPGYDAVQERFRDEVEQFRD